MDASTSDNTVAYPLLSCGSVTTTGTNRLLFVAGSMNGSNLNAGDGLILVGGGYSATETEAVATASTVSPTFHARDGASGSCVAVALRPAA